jgi:hypothetical protein
MAGREIEANSEPRPRANRRARLRANLPHQGARETGDQPARFGQRYEMHRRHQRPARPATRSPSTVPSDVISAAWTTCGPPFDEVRGSMMSAGISAASANPSTIARRMRTTPSRRSPIRMTSIAISARRLSIDAITHRWPKGIARLVQRVSPPGPTTESSLIGTIRNEVSCMLSRSESAQERTPRAARSSRASMTPRGGRACQRQSGQDCGQLPDLRRNHGHPLPAPLRRLWPTRPPRIARVAAHARCRPNMVRTRLTPGVRNPSGNCRTPCIGRPR